MKRERMGGEDREGMEIKERGRGVGEGGDCVQRGSRTEIKGGPEWRTEETERESLCLYTVYT